MMVTVSDRKEILGTPFDNIGRDVALSTILGRLKERDSRELPQIVFFTNVHTIYTCHQDNNLATLLSSADLVLPDGSGLAIGCGILGIRVVENLNGTDFTPELLSEVDKEGMSLYLLGGRPETVEKCKANIAKRYKAIRIVGASHGYLTDEEQRRVLKDLEVGCPDLLLVGMGTPYQETWIAQHRQVLRVKVCMGVGGLFDFLSEFVRRAPVWMRRLGIEWVYRFLHDPKSKWKRVFLEMPWFFFHVVLAKFGLRGERQRKKDDIV